MSQRKLRDLPHPLTLPKLLGSAGNWKPPGVSHELKEVKRSHRAVEQEATNPQPLQFFRGCREVLQEEGGHQFFPWLFSSGPFSPFSYRPGAAADSLQLLLCSLLLL